MLGFNLKVYQSWNPSRTRIRLRIDLHLVVLVPSLVQHLVQVLELLLLVLKSFICLSFIPNNKNFIR
jgi:hypothetical protein